MEKAHGVLGETGGSGWRQVPGAVAPRGSRLCSTAVAATNSTSAPGAPCYLHHSAAKRSAAHLIRMNPPMSAGAMLSAW